jgi:hypothetical protein
LKNMQVTDRPRYIHLVSARRLKSHLREGLQRVVRAVLVAALIGIVSMGKTSGIKEAPNGSAVVFD